jgi:hypothetical protein
MERTPEPCPPTVVPLRWHGGQYFERAHSEGLARPRSLLGSVELRGQGGSTGESVAVCAGHEQERARVYRVPSRSSSALVAPLSSPVESVTSRRTKCRHVYFSGQKRIVLVQSWGRRNAPA